MGTSKPLLAVLACVMVAAGSAQPVAAAPQESEETVPVVVYLPGGRKIIRYEKAQPSRVSARPGSTTVRRVMPDGSRVSYGAGEAASKPKRSTKAKPSSSTTPRTTPTTATAERVSTLGSPTYRTDGATGGQDVRFFDAGISAMVVGRTVYIWGAELIQSSAEFEVVEGERFSFDGAMALEPRSDNSGGAALTGGDTLFAPIKLEYAPDTQVDLVLHARAENPDEPDRAIRTWTFRVR